MPEVYYDEETGECYPQTKVPIPAIEACLETARDVMSRVYDDFGEAHRPITGYIVAMAINATPGPIADAWWNALKLHEPSFDDEFIATSIIGG